jgi:hypothetical protein
MAVGEVVTGSTLYGRLLALGAREFFEIAEADERQIIRETAHRISNEWREALRLVGISGSAARDYEPAFVNASGDGARVMAFAFEACRLASSHASTSAKSHTTHREVRLNHD